MIKDYPYVGMEFRGDPDLVLPDGVHWDITGMLLMFCNVFEFSYIYDFYECAIICLTCPCFYADIGILRPPGSSPLHRRGAGAPVGVGLEEVERNLEGLTNRILGLRFDEVPLHL